MELSSQRFVNLILHCLRENLTPEGLERMNQTIEEAGRTPHPWLAPSSVERSNNDRPPPGWLSDEQNWKNVQGFLGSGLVKAAGR